MNTYTTAQGDTFDQIALKQYGSELQSQALMVSAACELGVECLARWRFEQGFAPPLPVLADSGEYGEEQNTTAPAWRR